MIVSTDEEVGLNPMMTVMLSNVVRLILVADAAYWLVPLNVSAPDPKAGELNRVKWLFDPLRSNHEVPLPG